MPTIISGSIGRNVAPLTTRYWVIRSPMKNVEPRDVSLTIMINSLPSAGRMFFTAWGTTTNHMALLSLKPRLRAASFWPGSTAWMPERMTSDT